jgi:hypothetical protein
MAAQIQVQVLAALVVVAQVQQEAPVEGHPVSEVRELHHQ